MSLSESVRRQYLEAIGISVWERRADTGHPAVPADTGVACATISPDALDWTVLEAAVKGCTQCPLHRSRTQTVFGTGDRNARYLFIGEAPGADEDVQGEPFVGRAGQLLNAMIAAMGLRREDVYIANVLKCRPPGNRDPQPGEVEQCEPYLVRQIELIGPKLIIALGRHAAHSLTKTELPLARLRGQRLTYHGTPLVVTYHPAYLLRNLPDKRKAWEDLKQAMRWMETL